MKRVKLDSWGMKNPKMGEVIYETYNFPDGKNDDRWYHWNIQNWGTKWDITAELVLNMMMMKCWKLHFDTAWVHLNQFVKVA